MIFEKQKTNKHILVVEGGAMRGIFSAGVLDCFHDLHFNPFDACLGVSVGSTNLAAWLAGQRGRNYKVITDYSCRPEFISFRNFIRGGHWLDLDWLWPITIKEIRLDLKTFVNQPVPLYVVTTRVATGEAVYIEANGGNLEAVLKASCSVPLLYRGFPTLENEMMTDGGVADAIPVEKAYAMGAREITVILSHPWGYRKKMPKFFCLIRHSLKHYPELTAVMLKRAERYNRSLDFIASPPADCQVNLIAPPADFAVSRLTRDFDRLQQGYEQGLVAGEKFTAA